MSGTRVFDCAFQKCAYSFGLPNNFFSCSAIVLQLIQKREDIHRNAEFRRDADYVPYNGSEQPTQFWPWRIYRYPKKYSVGNLVDRDRCNKEYNKCKDFAQGVFLGGCHHGYTYGEELMIGKQIFDHQS